MIKKWNLCLIFLKKITFFLFKFFYKKKNIYKKNYFLKIKKIFFLFFLKKKIFYKKKIKNKFLFFVKKKKFFDRGGEICYISIISRIFVVSILIYQEKKIFKKFFFINFF